MNGTINARRRPLCWFVRLAVLAACGATQPGVAQQGEPEVEAADLTKIAVADFNDNELLHQLPYFLAHFHRLANSIQMSGPNRGFIALPVWRRERDNKPYNARVLENYVSLAYFYCTDRPWNPYYADAAVRRRLEALLGFWRQIQNDDGRFSEYGPQQWNLAATGFASMFMGRTLELLAHGPPLDQELHQQVIAAHKKALRALLTDEGLFDHGRGFSNQYGGLWGGALAHLRLYPDQELERLVSMRMADSLREHQSPAGYWYENNGCDWAYTLHTHHGNLARAWHYARGTDLEEPLVRGETRWVQWLSYNAVREPDGAGYVLNRAIETRRRDPIQDRENPLAEKVILARAFSPTDAELHARAAQLRGRLEQDWPDVGPLQTYSPHPILDLPNYRWLPSEAQRQAAVAQIPYLAQTRFNRQRSDDRFPQVFTFIRRPPYYAAFNAGQRLADQQRFGLGLLWTEAYGALLQSQTGSQDAAWGTRAADEKQVRETELKDVTYQIGDRRVAPQPGAQDLGPGDVTITYTFANGGSKTVAFSEDQVNVSVRLAGPLLEQLPLLLGPDAELRLETGAARLVDPRLALEISFSGETTPRLRELGAAAAGKRLAVLRLEARDTLHYRLAF